MVHNQMMADKHGIRISLYMHHLTVLFVSVADLLCFMYENHVYVMFRNFLNGNRDLYLIQSDDTGATFGTAQKLGIGSWQLDGCPMDGGSISMDAQNVQTV